MILQLNHHLTPLWADFELVYELISRIIEFYFSGESSSAVSIEMVPTRSYLQAQVRREVWRVELWRGHVGSVQLWSQTLSGM
jgi:hypothetical protein